MCGRTACTLAPHTVEAACRRLPVKDVKTTGDVDRYRRSHNTAPHQTTPVLIKQGDDLVVRYMRWGLVPSWYKGDIKSFKKTMINARKENLGHIKSFRRPLENKQRCVVLAEGFYEWKKAQGQKPQPFYVFFPPGSSQQPALEVPVADSHEDGNAISSQIKTEEEALHSSQDSSSSSTTTTTTTTTSSSSATQSSTSKSLPLMAFAGIYDVRHAGRKTPQAGSPGRAHVAKKEEEVVAGAHGQRSVRGGQGDAGAHGEDGEDKPLYTYTVITVPASKDLEWLHDRMPAVLPTREAMMAWLDTSSTPLMKALQLLEPYKGLGHYPVSPKVGKITNTGADCRAPMRPKKQANTLTRFLMPKSTRTAAARAETNKPSAGPLPANTTIVEPPTSAHVPLVAAMMKRAEDGVKRGHTRSHGGGGGGDKEGGEGCNPSKAAKRLAHPGASQGDDMLLVVSGDEGGGEGSGGPNTTHGVTATGGDKDHNNNSNSSSKEEKEEEPIVLE